MKESIKLNIFDKSLDRTILNFCSDALIAFSENRAREIPDSAHSLDLDEDKYIYKNREELEKITNEIITAGMTGQWYETVEEVLHGNSAEEAVQILKNPETAYIMVQEERKRKKKSVLKTIYRRYVVTDAEIFDRCLLLLQKQTEIEPPKSFPKLGKYDEKKRPHYRLCGDVLSLLARNASFEDMASWGEHQLSGKSDRYMDKDEIMKKVLDRLSLVAYLGFELTEGEIFLLAMELLACESPKHKVTTKLWQKLADKCHSAPKT
jgi:hypothetical protein